MKKISTFFFLLFSSYLRFCEANDTYDFIIVGAGSGGSVVASRLSENPKWKVLLIEAGENENFFTDVPLMAAFQTITRFNWGYRSQKMRTACLGLKYQKCNMPRGKGLGGTSIINFLIYTRGNRKDYDEWEQLGNPGWNYSSVFPYFIKSENCSQEIKSDTEYRGFEGPLNVEYAPFETPLVKTFLLSGKDMGYEINDPNGSKNIGFSKAQATMRKGRRWSVSKAYLSSIYFQRPNLKILLKTKVSKILINPKEKRAYGVQFLNEERVLFNAYAKKEVIISAGSINSPHLLMTSGIGPKEDLKRAKIPLIQDLKVGYNLQDHLSFSGLVFLLNKSVSISDLSVQNPIDVLNYILNSKGPYTIPGGAEALAFLKTKHNKNEVDDDYPDIELVMGAGGLNGDVYGSLRNLLGIPNRIYDYMYRPYQNLPGFGIATVLLRPKSKGRVLLDYSNPYKRPLIEPNYLQDETDLRILVEGIKMAVKIGQSERFKKFNSTLLAKSFPWCKHLSFGSDEYWGCAVRHIATTLGHQVGTCKMGPKSDPEAVVDSDLKVYGISNLRIVDGSIMPSIVAGHTNSVIIMIAEKISDLIKKEWMKL